MRRPSRRRRARALGAAEAEQLVRDVAGRRGAQRRSPGRSGSGPTLAVLETAGAARAREQGEPHRRRRAGHRDARGPAPVVPVDSEHSAIAQALRAGAHRRRCDGWCSRHPAGRSADASRESLEGVTPREALAHPTWDMGLVVTTNSATLVNKGLEVIEAHLLFDVPYDAIEVAVHPQSIVHSMVEFVDGSTIAQATPPDMRLPISSASAGPNRVAGVGAPLDWTHARARGPSSRSMTGRSRRSRSPSGSARRGGPIPRSSTRRTSRPWTAFHAGRVGFLGHRGDRRAGRRRARAARLRRRRRPHPRGSCSPPSAGLATKPIGSSPPLPTADPLDRRIAQAALRRSQRGWRSLAAWKPSSSTCSASLILVVGLALSIGLHEIGHLVPAKKFGVKVGQYMIGFGPTLWRQVGETEYGVKAIPLGGYISMAGMFPPARPGGRAHREHRVLQHPRPGRPRRLARRPSAAVDEDRGLLQASPVEAHHHHARRADHEPAARDRAVRDPALRLRDPAGHHDDRLGLRVRHPGAASRPSAAPTTRRRPAAAAGLQPGDRSSASTATT